VAEKMVREGVRNPSDDEIAEAIEARDLDRDALAEDAIQQAETGDHGYRRTTGGKA
jgi:hypothetical protein